MSRFLTHLTSLEECYRSLERDLGDSTPSDPGGLRATLKERVEQLASLSLRMQQLSTQTARLAEEWDSEGESASGAGDEVRQRAASLRRRASGLLKLCETHVAEISRLRAELARELHDADTGRRYLESVRPSKVNYPKFIDSRQ